MFSVSELITGTGTPGKEKPSVNLSIHIWAVVLRQRISEDCVRILNDLWFTRQLFLLLSMLNNGIMTCRNCVIMLKKTLNHGLQDRLQNGNINACLNFGLLSYANSSDTDIAVDVSCSWPERCDQRGRVLAY